MLITTLALHERRWSDVHVEPLPEQAALRRTGPGDVVVEAAATAGLSCGTPGRHTGLSTVDAAEASAHATEGADVVGINVSVTTLADLG